MAKENLGFDVVDRAPLKVIIEDGQLTENHKRKLSESSEETKTDLLALNLPLNNENFVKNDTSFEKIKKWYNTNFMHKLSSASTDTNNGKSKTSKMDNRHSWHLNESSEM